MPSTPHKRKRPNAEDEETGIAGSSPSKVGSQRRTRRNPTEDEDPASAPITNVMRTPSKSRGVIFVSTADTKLKTPKSGRGRGGGRGDSRTGPGRHGKGKETEEPEDDVADSPSKGKARRRASAVEAGRVLGNVKTGTSEVRTRGVYIGSQGMSAHDSDGPREEEMDDEEQASEPGSSEEGEDAAESDGLSEMASPSKSTLSKKGIGGTKSKEPQSIHHVPGFVTLTSFDLYLQAISIPSRTSSNAFTSLLPTLAPDEYSRLLSDSISHSKHSTELRALQDSHVAYFSRYLTELQLGFNILFYGFGSKRNILNRFAKESCATAGDVIVLNGFRPGVGIKDVLSQLDQLRLKAGTSDHDDDIVDAMEKITVSGLSAASSALDAQAQRIYRHFRPHTGTAPRRVFIIIHNIDSQNLRNSRSKAILGLLASSPRIHLVASIDHLNAPLIWTESEALGRGHNEPIRNTDDSDDAINEDVPQTAASTSLPSERNFTWLWHDLTTFEHYDVEMAAQGRDLTSVTVSGSGKIKGGLSTSGGVGSGNASGPAGTAGPLTEAGAHQVISSVTDRSKKLFVLLAKKQLASIEVDTDDRAAATTKGTNVTASQMVKHAVSYDHLFSAAREGFIATSDPALRGLLQEFRDHGMVTTAATTGGGGGEVIWIPIARNVLERILEGIES